MFTRKCPKCNNNLHYKHKKSLLFAERHNTSCIKCAKGNPIERFWSYVKKTDTCWLWTGCSTHLGYAQIGVNYKLISVHRFSWEIHNGPIPEGKWVLHKCDNPSCVRPDHLFLGTPKDNTQDMLHKHRDNGPKGERQHCHKFTAEEVMKIRASTDSQSEIARQYKVNQSTISHIINHQTWKHIT